MGRPLGSKDRQPRKKYGSRPLMTHSCVLCNQDFQTRRTAQKPRCDDCVRVAAAERRRAGKYHERPEYKEKARAWRLANYYQITSEEYERLLRVQGGNCAICHNPPPAGQNLPIDHDHKTGRVRGLLCHKCNVSLGNLRDDPRHLKAAISYLLRCDPVRSWDTYFMQLAEHVATRSKDASTQVGAVLVRSRNIISTGYNGFPRGVNDNIPARHERPEKYQWTVHAEENAILNASRNGVATDGATVYVTPLAPCIQCAKAIVQSGIKEVVYEVHGDQSRWAESTEAARNLLSASGVVVRSPE
jgi:dCMP deaminase